MPPAVAIAGVAAAGAVGSAAIGSSAAKKAAKTQAAAGAAANAQTIANRDYVSSLSAPTIERGNAAGTQIAGLLGVGSDPAASKAALDTFRGSSGYNDLLQTGLKAVNSNAYAQGMGDSSAAMKALQAKGASIADSSQQQYIGNLGNLAQMGQSAIGNVAGAATNATNTINATNMNTAEAQANSTYTQSALWSKVLQGLANVGGATINGGNAGSVLGSSYGINNLPPQYRTGGY
jgi:hypothetical protein